MKSTVWWCKKIEKTLEQQKKTVLVCLTKGKTPIKVLIKKILKIALNDTESEVITKAFGEIVIKSKDRPDEWWQDFSNLLRGVGDWIRITSTQKDVSDPLVSFWEAQWKELRPQRKTHILLSLDAIGYYVSSDMLKQGEDIKYFSPRTWVWLWKQTYHQEEACSEISSCLKEHLLTVNDLVTFLPTIYDAWDLNKALSTTKEWMLLVDEKGRRLIVNKVGKLIKEYLIE